MAKSLNRCLCRRRKFFKKSKTAPVPGAQQCANGAWYKDEMVWGSCPCQPVRSCKDPYPKTPKKRKRRRRRRKVKFATFKSRYREKLDPGSNVPVFVGIYDHWRYGRDYIYSQARPWYDPTGISGSRMWDQTHPPREMSKHMLWRTSTTGVHPTVPELSDFGGPLRLLRTYCPWHIVKGNIKEDNHDGITYEGGFVPTHWGSHPDPPPWEMAWSESPDQDYGNSSQYGAAGWDKSKPVLQGVDLAAALYELREFPDMLRTSSKGFSDLYSSIAKGHGRPDFGREAAEMADFASEHFLNHAFGWVPFLKDMSDTYQAAKGFKQAFEQHRRDNGRWVRRRRTVLKSKTEVSDPATHNGQYAYVWPDIWPLGRWDTIPGGEVKRGYTEFVYSTELHAWFAGTFKYWVPDLVHDQYSTYSYVANRARYYGLRVNPNLIYKLTPWSWLGDWFTQAGKVRSAILDAPEDNLVARYAYVMCTLIKKTIHRSTIFLADDKNCNVQWSAYVESKHRSRASPFGFGLSSGDLSARQLAILGSLGIQRV